MLASLCLSLTAMGYPIITRLMLNDYIPNRKYNLIIYFGLGLLLIYVIRALLRFFIQYEGHVMGVNMQADMRNELFAKIQNLPFNYFDNQETGKIMSRLTSDLFEVSELAHHGPENLIVSTLTIAIAFIYLTTISLPLTLIIFAIVPILLVVSYKLRGRMHDASKKSKAAIAIINANSESSISGIRVTKAFNNAKIEEDKFAKSNIDYINARKGHYITFAQFHSTSSFITDIFNVVCLISGGIFLYNGKISLGDYSTFIVSISLFLSPVNLLISFIESLEEGITGFERFCEIMDQPEEEDNENALVMSELNGDIEFKNVSFSYNTFEEVKEVLDDVSFKLKKGKTLALVGPSGGGKTTICHLIPRFYQHDIGKITINNIDINNISLESLRNNIGIVQQDVFLFAGTFYDNIVYGKSNATKEEVIQASKKANIYDYIMSLPNGFETQIGERGVKLSGGQKQRLSIARVFLKNPSILILDEATSALDNTTEVLIQKSLDTLKQGRTTIVVAHRLSTIKKADEIIVVANGKIIEQGTHEQLLNKEEGTYKDLYEAQFNEYSQDIDDHLMMN